MQTFLDGFAARLAADVHAVIVLDQAGWHGARALQIPDNVTFVPLPPYSPELNPVERLWLYLRERFLSLRPFPDYDAIVDACYRAWNALAAEPGRAGGRNSDSEARDSTGLRGDCSDAGVGTRAGPDRYPGSTT